MGDGERSDPRTLGETLSAARAARALSIEQLSTATRISPRMLEALEADDLRSLGTPVYARGFVRTLARELSLDNSALLQLLQLQLDIDAGRSPAVGRAATWRVDQVRVVRPQASRSVLPGRLLLLSGLVVVATLLGVWLGRRGRSVDRVPTAATAPPAGSSTAQGQPPARSAAPTRATPSPSASPAVAAPVSPPASEATSAIEEPGQPPATAAADAATRADSLAAVLADSANAAAAAAPPPRATPNRAANAPAEVVVLPQSRGLGSVVREGIEPGTARPLLLEVRALAATTLTVGVDASAGTPRVLASGQTLKLTAHEGFTLSGIALGSVQVWLDGVLQTPPAGAGAWRLPAPVPPANEDPQAPPPR